MLDEATIHFEDIDDTIALKLTSDSEYPMVNPLLRCLVDALFDEKSGLSKLSGTTHILQKIWNLVKVYWYQCICYGSEDDVRDQFLRTDDPHNIFMKELAGEWSFPKESDLQINMMPFIMERTFEQCRLPEYLRPYWDSLIAPGHYSTNSLGWWPLISNSEVGKVGFLTIHEGFVEAGSSQRRGGVHTECPGIVTLKLDPADGKYICVSSTGLSKIPNTSDLSGCSQELSVLSGCSPELSGSSECDQERVLMGEGDTISMMVGWGMGGGSETELIGGVYMASNTADSCEVWNCHIEPDAHGKEVIGPLGDVEHLRDLLPISETMQENTIYWMTDRTPHESMPVLEDTYRQYFRLVTSQVSVWFEEHSTPNPLGVVPDPDITKIIKGSKFV